MTVLGDYSTEWIREYEIRTIVIGTGAAGYHAALRLYQFGEKNLAVITEDVHAGTSRNTGSDKQTYYKLSLAGPDADSVTAMAEDLFSGQCVDGDLALCEAALSARCFYHLKELGVPFPDNEYGECMGYKTDHDRGRRASSVGPYTSRIMTECLEEEVFSREIPVLDHMQLIKILVRENQICGVLCLDRSEPDQASFVILWCGNLVLATGGPAGMYHDSVYPVSQFGSSGLAFEAGIKGKNLTEWQFGMASLNPRWNVSGTYMQVLPRFVSTDANGKNEREFLTDYFEDTAQMQHLIFLKGYQWPFDTNKIFGGSSLIDLLVYQETVLRRRRVFLDFTCNSGGKDVDFKRLPSESREYLKKAGACFGTPIQRLEQMNEPAILFYREHGVDLYRDWLEIAVCVQHNNGGLCVDSDWQTNVKGIYAVGEAAGSHGVTRPGGSALNAGQVGSLRAAAHIGRNLKQEKRMSGNSRKHTCTESDKAQQYVLAEEQSGKHHIWRAECREEAIRFIRKTGSWVSAEECAALWENAVRRMSRVGGMIRNEDELKTAVKEVNQELERFEIVPEEPETVQKAAMEDFFCSKNPFRLRDMLLSQKVYLSAMLDYIQKGGVSRGSALYTCPEGEKPEENLPEIYRCQLAQGHLGDMIQEMQLTEGTCTAGWRPVKPIPEPDYFFENQWKAFRERECLP